MDISRIILPTTGIRLNEIDFVNYMENLKTLNICKYNPPSWLQHTENPFKWAQILDRQKMIKCDIDMKLNDYPEEDPDGCYSYEIFCLHLVKVFQKVIIEDDNQARQSLQSLKDFLEKISRNESDYVYNRISEAFNHVILAVTAQVLLSIGDITEEDSQNIGLNLSPFSKMEPKVQAGIEAIKARFYLSCSSSISELALNYIKEATELDPKCAAWLYWTGKVIRKIRRSKKDMEPKEEIEYFESALDMKRDPKYILFLAQGYREKAQHLLQQSKYSGFNDNESIKEDELFEKSHQLYNECWNLKKDSAAINRRLGNGAISLKEPNNDLAELCLTKALEISNNPCTYHQLGSFYSKHKKDYQKAIEYFTKGAEHGLMHCFNELIRIKYILGINFGYDPFEDLTTVEDVMKYSVDLPTLYSDFVWYYLTIKPDLCKTVEYVFKILEKKDHDYLKTFRSYTFLVNRRFNLYPILKEEVLQYQEQNIEQVLDNVTLEKFLDEINENPDLVSQDNGDNSLSSLKQDSLNSLNYWRKTFNYKKNIFGLNPKTSGYWKEKFKETNHGRPQDYSMNIQSCSKSNWRNEQREITSFRNRNSNSFQDQKYQSKDTREMKSFRNNGGSSFQNQEYHSEDTRGMNSFRNKGGSSFQNQKYHSEDNYNWRTECKDN